MYTGMPVIVVAAAAAATLAACGPAEPSKPAAPATMTAAQPAAVVAVKAGANSAALPPNSDGDPGCPASDAWGKNPFGTGIVVTHLSDDTAPVTVLVRTANASDRAQHAMLNPGELRLFEFPDVDKTAVAEVLIMTNTRRCFVAADPAALG